MPEHDHSLGSQGLSSVTHPLGTIVLPRDREHDLSSHDPLLHKAKQLVDSALAREGGIKDGVTCAVVEMKQKVLGEVPPANKPRHRRQPFVIQATLLVLVQSSPQPGITSTQDADPKLRPVVVCRQAQAQFTYGLGRDHPGAGSHRPFGVHLLFVDQVVQSSAALQPELILDDNLDLGADVGLLNLAELLDSVATGSLAVEDFVEALTDGGGESLLEARLVAKPGDCPLESLILEHRRQLLGLALREGVLEHVVGDGLAEQRRNGIADLTGYLNLGAFEDVPVREGLEARRFPV